MNVITGRGIASFIGGIFALGVCIHFWYVLVALVGLAVVVRYVDAVIDRRRRRVRPVARRGQAHYSNRR